MRTVSNLPPFSRRERAGVRHRGRGHRGPRWVTGQEDAQAATVRGGEAESCLWTHTRVHPAAVREADSRGRAVSRTRGQLREAGGAGAATHGCGTWERAPGEGCDPLC